MVSQDPTTLPAKLLHIIGFDIMLDENQKAWLIEINNNPSMSIKHEHGFMDSKSSEPSPIDAEIKKPLLYHTIMAA